MRDEVVEVLVKCKNNSAMIVLKIVMIVLCVLAVASAVLLFGTVAFVVAVLCGWLAYFAKVRSKVEYEYTYFQKELQVDVIYSQEKRKSVASYDLSKMEACVQIGANKMKEFERRQFTVKNYSSNLIENQKQVYALIYDGSMKILFEPNEKLLNALKYDFPRKVFEY